MRLVHCIISRSSFSTLPKKKKQHLDPLDGRTAAADEQTNQMRRTLDHVARYLLHQQMKKTTTKEEL